PGLLHVADLQDHVAELASLDHACAPRAVAAPRRSRRMPYTLSPDASIDARGGQVMGIAESGALRGKVAIITGAATGIGRASALLFAQAGAKVALADAREPELARTVTDVRAAGAEAASITADLTHPEACAAVVTETVRAFGRLDVLLNNAGVGTMVVGGTVET